MPIDLTKLTPAPWTSGVGGADDGSRYLHPPRPMSVFTAGMNHPNGIWEAAWFITQTDRDFAVLARNAFDVMMRRKWTAKPRENGWAVYDVWIPLPSDPSQWPDPFTALVEADAWYKQNVEAAPERP